MMLARELRCGKNGGSAGQYVGEQNQHLAGREQTAAWNAAVRRVERKSWPS